MTGYNHHPGCRCGWCTGGGGRGNRSYSYNVQYQQARHTGADYTRLNFKFETYINPNAVCPVCGADVYFYQSPYGGRVFFDELGPPWPKHPCTDAVDVYYAPRIKWDQRIIAVRPTPVWATMEWVPIVITGTSRQGAWSVLEGKLVVSGNLIRLLSSAEPPELIDSACFLHRPIGQDVYEISYVFDDRAARMQFRTQKVYRYSTYIDLAPP